jgi:glycosyltransferase involved in cell wall biosynthesis
MKIVIVNDFAHVNGGASQVALGSARALAERGHDVSFFSAVGPIDPSLQADGVEVVCTGQHEILTDPNRWRAAAQGLWNAAAAGRFERSLDRFERRGSVIHLHGWTKALSSSVARVAIRRGFKVVVTLHDYFLACPNGGFLDYPAARPCGLRALSAQCLLRRCDSRSYPQKLWRVARQILQHRVGLLPRGVRNYIAVSDFSYEALRGYLPRGNRLHRIDNPVETPRQAPVEIARNAKFAFVGRLSPEKGALMLASCASALGAELMLIGDGPQRPAVAAAYERANITGWLPRCGVVERLRSARALVLPSLWWETQGLVVLEAAALGVPAIVPDRSAARESVVDGITGLCFRQGDEYDLAAKMRRMQTPGAAERMGRAAYERYWSSPRTLERHVMGLEACYREILDAA